MKPKHSLLALVAVFAAALPLASQAAAVTRTGAIKFTGKVTAPSCSVNGSTAMAIADINVTLNDVSMDKVQALASKPSHPKTHSITITCTGAKNLTVSLKALNGTNTVTGQNSILKNTASSSAAAGVGIALYEKGTGTSYNLVSGKLLDKPTPSASEIITFDAAYVQDPAVTAMTAGPVQADLPFELSYD
ncbi:type 1 fimbrial protein [Chromobacterium alkanivorans]|uniref:fimbrial protein n=1 Tax=Chromobacterium alkanivorans TaxID=1071719 RepID=UPI0019685A5E|nr:fimbrial protein [Chromobacterium alkanivorans]MBN3006085.1 type 1 fimbrial protein [Chromobacterium alkanivorans]